MYFSLLQNGAKNFVIKPFSEDVLEDALVQATMGEAFNPAILNSDNRNESLLKVVVAQIDKTALAIKDAERHSSAEKKLPILKTELFNSVKMTKAFSEGEESDLMDSVQDVFEKLGEGPSYASWKT